mmetsp:Transcript_77907/g.252630  ORF Transcript_77907/g.252630 Transcript_77907/m.252630 type:complete len:513 (+) Transcript_77907:167-1705(+)
MAMVAKARRLAPGAGDLMDERSELLIRLLEELGKRHVLPFISCVGMSRISVALALRACSNPCRAAADGLIGSLHELSVCDRRPNGASDDESAASSDVDGDCEVPSEILTSVLELPWRILHIKKLSVGRHAGKALDDAFLNCLMRRLELSRAEEIGLLFQGTTQLIRPACNAWNVCKVSLGEHGMGYESNVERVTVLPNLSTLELHYLPELRHISCATRRNTLRQLRVIETSVCARDLSMLLKHHADSLERVALDLPFTPHANSGLVDPAACEVLDALASLRACEALRLRFQSTIPMEKLVPLLKCTKHFVMEFIGNHYASPTLGGLGLQEIEPVQRETEVLQGAAPLAVESIALRNMGWLRHEWAGILECCTDLRFYAASSSGVCKNTLIEYWGDFAEDVYVLPSSITHIYETRSGVVGHAGPWGLQAKTEAQAQAFGEARALEVRMRDPEFEQELCGIRWTVRPEGPPRACRRDGDGEGEARVHSLTVEGLEAELVREHGSEWRARGEREW